MIEAQERSTDTVLIQLTQAAGLDMALEGIFEEVDTKPKMKR